MKPCRCEGILQSLYQEALDAVTMNAGYRPVSFEEVVADADNETVGNVRLIAKLEGRPVRDVWDTLASYCSLIKPMDEMKLAENELVDIKALLPKEPAVVG